MSPELVKELLSLEEANLGGECKEVSILFSDMRGYTTLADSLAEEEVVALLNEYFEWMVEPIFQYFYTWNGGVIVAFSFVALRRIANLQPTQLVLSLNKTT